MGSGTNYFLSLLTIEIFREIIGVQDGQLKKGLCRLILTSCISLLHSCKKREEEQKDDPEYAD